MNYKKLLMIFVVILLAVCILFSGCNHLPTLTAELATEEATSADMDVSVTEDYTNSVFPKGTVTVDKDTVTYNDGKIEFQWDKNDWFLSSDANGLPYLEKRIDGLVIYFKVFDCIEGTAGDLAEFSCGALQKAFPDYDSNKQFACGSDESCDGKDCFGIQTGYYTHLESREGNAMAMVHSLSNGDVSCVYGVLFDSGDEKVAELHDELLNTHDPTFLEDYVRDVLDTFHFAS